MIFEDNY